jgi:hypothetical protein
MGSFFSLPFFPKEKQSLEIFSDGTNANRYKCPNSRKIQTSCRAFLPKPKVASQADNNNNTY